MANAVVDTGHNTTCTLGTTTFVSNVTNINAGQRTIADIATTHLSTSVSHTFAPGDLIDQGEVTIDYQFDPAAVKLTPKTVPETLTITLPTTAAYTVAGTLAGTGYIKSVTDPVFATDTLQVAQFVFKWNGLTGPTFTPATAS